MLKNLPLLALLALGDVTSATAATLSFLRLKNLENTEVSDFICASNAFGIRPCIKCQCDALLVNC